MFVDNKGVVTGIHRYYASDQLAQEVYDEGLREAQLDMMDGYEARREEVERRSTPMSMSGVLQDE